MNAYGSSDEGFWQNHACVDSTPRDNLYCGYCAATARRRLKRVFFLWIWSLKINALLFPELYQHETESAVGSTKSILR